MTLPRSRSCIGEEALPVLPVGRIAVRALLEYALLEPRGDNLARFLVGEADRATGQSWICDPYTFDMMAEVVHLLLSAFRPGGEVRMPETFQLVRFDPSLDRIPQLRRLKEELRANAARARPEDWAYSIAGAIIISLQERGSGRDARERAIFERLDKLRDLLSDPILKQADPQGPMPEEEQQ